MKRLFLLLSLAIDISVTAQSAEQQDTVAARELDEIVVKGEKPQISAKDGVMTVDLPEIVKDKPVTNVLEALKYLPGVTSDNGLISLAGASSVSIIINGEVTNMPIQNLYQLLYSTPVDKLKNVEIAYAAPAKYHVKGAVINVVLKTPRPIDGLMGQVKTGYTQAHYASCDGGVAATYAIKDWTFDVNWSINKAKTFSRQVTRSNHLVGDVRHLIDDDMRQIGSNICNTMYASTTFKGLRLAYNGQITADSKAKSLSSGTFGDYRNIYEFIKPINFHNIAARYKSTFGLEIGGDYTYYNEGRNQNLLKDYEQLVNALTQQQIDKYHVYIDQEHAIRDWTINYGADYQRSNDNSSQEYILPELNGFDERTSEDVVNVYLALQHSFAWGLSFSASATGEYFHNRSQSKFNFIPQVGATFYRSPKSIFQLSFTSRRIYPAYWALHGGTSYINDYSMIVGNPNLQPYLNYSGQLSYIFKQKYAATFYVLYSDDYSVQLPYQKPDELRLLFQTLNLDYSRTVGVQAQAPFTIGSVLNSTAVVNLSDKREKASAFHDISFDSHKLSLYAALRNSITPMVNSPISISIDFSYLSGSIQGNGVFESMWRTDIGGKWRFGKNRCCELVIMWNDVFNTWKPCLRIKSHDQDYKMKVYDSARNMSATFVWKFNGFKPKNTEIDTSRYGAKQ
ncbi:MAG: outer membrane beta-barrel protein [Muribaculaceae bacterium]|nr:outer membrane beta-barrel protein [Muribaculaceae bacterium]